MTRIAITGAAGRMGRSLINACHHTDGLTVTVALEHPDSSLLGSDAGELAGLGQLGVTLGADINAVLDDFDVLIDFTRPLSTLDNLAACRQAGAHFSAQHALPGTAFGFHAVDQPSVFFFE